MCLCTCHESAFTVGFLGMYGAPCIVADIFSSVFQEALSPERMFLFDTLCVAQLVVGLYYAAVAYRAFDDYNPIWSRI